MTQYRTDQETSGKIFGILSGLVIIVAWFTLFLFIHEQNLPFFNQIYLNLPLFEWINIGPGPPVYRGRLVSFHENGLARRKTKTAARSTKRWGRGLFPVDCRDCSPSQC